MSSSVKKESLYILYFNVKQNLLKESKLSKLVQQVFYIYKCWRKKSKNLLHKQTVAKLWMQKHVFLPHSVKKGNTYFQSLSIVPEGNENSCQCVTSRHMSFRDKIKHSDTEGIEKNWNKFDSRSITLPRLGSFT